MCGSLAGQGRFDERNVIRSYDLGIFGDSGA